MHGFEFCQDQLDNLPRLDAFMLFVFLGNTSYLVNANLKGKEAVGYAENLGNASLYSRAKFSWYNLFIKFYIL